MLPPALDLGDASIEKLTRLVEERRSHDFVYTARRVALEHLRPAARLLRHADMLVLGAVLQVALRIEPNTASAATLACTTAATSAA